ncbi:KOW motif domain-containing protein [Phaeosphaeriaceae sp. PMI808]|nr:KOW motif domain-containing protein [Phaeosphaeriaceae sp. PMI808]
MSQLVVRPGRNATRQAKKLKEIRKVQGAIEWHERERKKRQTKLQERWETKQAVIQRLKWETEHITAVRKQALTNAKEDWHLGPLRPNRAIGVDADKYGAMTREQVQRPEVPVHSQKRWNEVMDEKGIKYESPIIVDDKKYFHIEKEDRVVIIKGKDKGKIGVVQHVQSRTHGVFVTGINMQYYDSDVLDLQQSISTAPKIEKEAPVPIDDVRLVIPYKFTQNGREVIRDAVVERVVMERHTTGIDPFTGIDHGKAEIPEKHRYDPTTGLPIFHRYIAGTRHRIEWPHEKEVEIEESAATKEEKPEKQSIIGKTLGAIRHPVTSFQRWKNEKPKPTTTKPEDIPVSTRLETLERDLAEKRKAEKPQSRDPQLRGPFSNDTTRNIVEGSESMAYTLVAPPFPDTLGEELRGHIQESTAEARKNGDQAPRPKRPTRVTEKTQIANEVAKMKHAAAQRMKTPMQLRWEADRAKKIQQQKTAPLVSTDDLMVALGGHIRQQRKAKKLSARVEAVE